MNKIGKEKSHTITTSQWQTGIGPPFPTVSVYRFCWWSLKPEEMLMMMKMDGLSEWDPNWCGEAWKEGLLLLLLAAGCSFSKFSYRMPWISWVPPTGFPLPYTRWASSHNSLFISSSPSKRNQNILPKVYVNKNTTSIIRFHPVYLFLLANDCVNQMII